MSFGGPGLGGWKVREGFLRITDAEALFDKYPVEGVSADILVPFPPFKKMHRLFGPQPGHPMSWCHFGMYPKVDPSDLVVAGDYENEAKLLKKKLESMFGIEMTERKKGARGYEYSDEYNRIDITLDMKTHQGSTVHHYPLVVNVWDLELERQGMQIRRFFEKAKESMSEKGPAKGQPDKAGNHRIPAEK